MLAVVGHSHPDVPYSGEGGHVIHDGSLHDGGFRLPAIGIDHADTQTVGAFGEGRDDGLKFFGSLTEVAVNIDIVCLDEVNVLGIAIL